MSNIEKYRKYFTKDYLMGPNSFRLLDELIRRSPDDVCYSRTLDLGCGFALTSIFLANEANAGSVYAFDLWISASENYTRIRDNHLEDRIIPIHGDAMDMPFAHEYFDSIVSVDAYHYFGCREGVFAEKILPFIRKGGYAMIAVPG
ncbi:MAG: class I SAM-dependent methyltransferase, partial [Clostridia bacterium]|nr:class I SAM-dependent methyltransferase [Clostridia bacterium]